MSAAVFISYRRDDSWAESGLIAHAVRGVVGDDQVFIDFSSVEYGSVWPDRIRSALAGSRYVLAIVGPDWLRAGSDKWGQRRIDQRTDWVRLELESALQDENKIVIPVLVRGGRVPPEEALPAELAALPKRQAIELRRDYWDHDIKLLSSQLAFNQGAKNSPLVVTSKILDADYVETVGLNGRRILVPASGHIVRLTVEALDSRTTIIHSLSPIVVSRSEAIGSLSFQLGIVSPRPFEVLLDETPPCVKALDSTEPNFPFKVGPGDPEVFELKVLTSSGDVQWRLELSWTSLGQEGTASVDLGGFPFRTMARPRKA